jgi:hypothetical protein
MTYMPHPYMDDHTQEEENLAQDWHDQANDTMPVPRYDPWPAGAVKLSQLPPLSKDEQAKRLGYFRKIVREKQAQPVHWIDRDGKRRRLTVDLTTAGMVCQVCDKMQPEQAATVLHLPPERLIKFLWGCVS